MDHLINTAERLKNVREACESFLALWTIEQVLDTPEHFDNTEPSIHEQAGGYWKRMTWNGSPDNP